MLAGGVNLNNISDYLAVKASCILIGSSIIRPELVKTGDWQAITDLARQIVQKTEDALSNVQG
jgi:2-keto-3-deoxy-6-phosphogluconate aldolase